MVFLINHDTMAHDIASPLDRMEQLTTQSDNVEMTLEHYTNPEQPSY